MPQATDQLRSSTEVTGGPNESATFPVALEGLILAARGTGGPSVQYTCTEGSGFFAEFTMPFLHLYRKLKFFRFLKHRNSKKS